MFFHSMVMVRPASFFTWASFFIILSSSTPSSYCRGQGRAGRGGSLELLGGGAAEGLQHVNWTKSQAASLPLALLPSERTHLGGDAVHVGVVGLQAQQKVGKRH